MQNGLEHSISLRIARSEAHDSAVSRLLDNIKGHCNDSFLAAGKVVADKIPNTFEKEEAMQSNGLLLDLPCVGFASLVCAAAFMRCLCRGHSAIARLYRKFHYCFRVALKAAKDGCQKEGTRLRAHKQLL